MKKTIVVIAIIVVVVVVVVVIVVLLASASFVAFFSRKILMDPAQLPPRRSSRQGRENTRYGQDFQAFRNPSRPTPQQLQQRQQRNIEANQQSEAATIRDSSQAGPSGLQRRLEPVSGPRAVAAIDRIENRPDFEERGQTRSGARFAARNLPHFSSMKELLAHHQRLLVPGPVVNTRYVKVGRGVVLQTCIRFRSDHPNIRSSLTRVLAELLRELGSPEEGLEVTLTFNAVLADRKFTSFSLFYGQDYGEQSEEGSNSRLGHSRPVVVRNLLQIRRVPTEFDLEELAQRYSLAFESSDVVVAKLINVVYLVHHYQRRHDS